MKGKQVSVHNCNTALSKVFLSHSICQNTPFPCSNKQWGRFKVSVDKNTANARKPYSVAIVWTHWSRMLEKVSWLKKAYVKVTLFLDQCQNFKWKLLPPFLLIRNFGKQNTCENISKISVSLMCYRHIGSKSTNHSPLTWLREGQKVTLVAVIDGFRSDLSITRMTDRNFGNVSTGVLFSKVAYQRKWW